jgi:predicted transposase/invertase (TIGR01784 family)
MNELSNPHDRYFKETFSRPEIVRDFLSNYLPPVVAESLDLNTLELQPDSFIDQDLEIHFSDLLFQVRTNDPLYSGSNAH